MKKIVCTQSFSQEELNKIKSLSADCGICEDTAKILFARGYDTVSKIKTFLNPSVKHFNNPFLFKNMQKVIDRINLAKSNGETVLVYGDYDADGICATTVLYNALVSFGVSTLTAIPNRDDGYGLNFDIVLNAYKQKPFSLIITVDCGISDKEVIENLQNNGFEVIVTDHHEVPATIPNCLIINPKEDSNYPFNCLCGAGVAFKVAYALIGEKALEYLDFVALATVADSMELKGENRDIVYEGLKIFNKGLHPQFSYLLSTNNGKPITSQTLAYLLAPKINAPGRMGDALAGLRLFLATSDDEIRNLSVQLSEYNTCRQIECEKLYIEAKQKLANIKDLGSIIMLYDENWRTGFVGIVASRLAEEYSLPTILFAGLDGNLKGSARSVEGVNLFEAVSFARDLTIEYGGHAQAVGVAIHKDNFNAFYNKVNNYIQQNFSSQALIPTVYVEKYFDKEIDVLLCKDLERLEPFGVENRKPLFAVKVGRANARCLKNGSKHITFKTRAAEMLNFNGENNIQLLNSTFCKDIVFELSSSTYMGKTTVKGIVKDILVDADDYENLTDFEKSLYQENFAINEVRGLDFSYMAFGNIYHTLQNNVGKKFSSALQFFTDNSIKYDCRQFIVCTHVFMELGLISNENQVLNVNKGIKNKLENSLLYLKVTEQKC